MLRRALCNVRNQESLVTATFHPHQMFLWNGSVILSLPSPTRYQEAKLLAPEKQAKNRPCWNWTDVELRLILLCFLPSQLTSSQYILTFLRLLIIPTCSSIGITCMCQTKRIFNFCTIAFPIFFLTDGVKGNKKCHNVKFEVSAFQRKTRTRQILQLI